MYINYAPFELCISMHLKLCISNALAKHVFTILLNAFKYSALKYPN